MNDKNWFVASIEFLLGLLSTGRPRIDAFLGMLAKICVLMILMGLLITMALGAMTDVLPTLLEPLQNLIGSGAEALGDAIQSSDQGAVNQVPAGLVTDVPNTTSG